MSCAPVLQYQVCVAILAIGNKNAWSCSLIFPAMTLLAWSCTQTHTFVHATHLIMACGQDICVDQPMSLVAQLYPDKCVAALVNLWSMKHRTTVTRSITLGNLCIGCLCAQDLAQGRSLAELVKGGWRADEGEVTRIAKELLNILDYLASRRPAVTHR